MKIREFRIEDKKHILSLWEECGLIVPWNNPEQDIERKMKVDPDLFLVGEEHGQIVAAVMGGYEGHRGWINYLAIGKAFRKKGYGKEMMAAVEKKLKDRGCPKICLQVRATNRDVIAFYRAIGYADDQVLGLGKRLVRDRPYKKGK